MTRLRPGDVVAWPFDGSLQVGVIDSIGRDTAYVYRLVPHARQSRRLPKPLDALVLVVPGCELGPQLTAAARRAATAALRR